MRSALVLGYGQIGTQTTHDLAAAGIDVTVVTRSRPKDTTRFASAASAFPTANVVTDADRRRGEQRPESGAKALPPNHGRITWVQGDAASTSDVSRVAAETTAEAIFACVHTTYDSRAWARTLPALESAIMDAAAALDIPVIFPESVYAFAGLDSPITADSPFAPVEDKGRIRQQLLEARSAHPARVASVLAGDLLGATASPLSSVVRLCITDRIAAGRRAVVPARTDVAHGITVIDDLAAAMIEAASALVAESTAGTHLLVIAPSANPTLTEVAAYTHEAVGSTFTKPIALPHALVRIAGWFDRSMFELAELAPIWRRPCTIDSRTERGLVAEADWRSGIDQMFP